MLPFQIHLVTDSEQLRTLNVSNHNVILNAILEGAKACQVSDIYHCCFPSLHHVNNFEEVQEIIFNLPVI